MAKYYHGAGRAGPYFEGWYLKCQTKDGRGLALIPALHVDRAGAAQRLPPGHCGRRGLVGGISGCGAAGL